ncbi:MAG: TonB family protein [Ottowia sp.]|nr:TonB family protein [Ottowia sp.]
MTASRFSRNAAAAAFVLLLHAGALWAFNHGLMHKPAAKQPEVIVMAQLVAPEPLPLGEEGEAPAGIPDEPAQPAPPPPPKEKPKPKPKPKPKLKPTPKPVAKPEPAPEPTPLAVADSEAARAAAAPAIAAPPAAPAESSGAGEPATQHASHGGGNAGSSSGNGKGLQGSGTGGGGVVLPSSSAAYLRNPKPAYPSMSRRLGETGRSVIRVLVGADGSAKNVRLQRSSGFDRLDQAALDAVRRWRFVPGTRGGVPEDMWFNVPIVWQLN